MVKRREEAYDLVRHEQRSAQFPIPRQAHSRTNREPGRSPLEGQRFARWPRRRDLARGRTAALRRSARNRRRPAFLASFVSFLRRTGHAVRPGKSLRTKGERFGKHDHAAREGRHHAPPLVRPLSRRPCTSERQVLRATGKFTIVSPAFSPLSRAVLPEAGVACARIQRRAHSLHKLCCNQ